MFFIFAVSWKIAETSSITHRQKNKCFETVSSHFHPSRNVGKHSEKEFATGLATKVKAVIFPDKWEELFPASCDPQNADKFDITLLYLLIREFSNLPTPVK